MSMPLIMSAVIAELRDVVNLADTAMEQANRDGAEFDRPSELRQARAIIAEFEAQEMGLWRVTVRRGGMGAYHVWTLRGTIPDVMECIKRSGPEGYRDCLVSIEREAA